jgi:SAM-dependent methyltransferase
MSTSEENDLSRLWKRGYLRFAEHISSLLPDSEDTIILELGCGSGQLTLPLASKLEGEIIAVDSSAENVEMLKKKLKTMGLEKRVEARISDAKDLFFDKGSIDSAISNFFFGWVDEIKADQIIKIINNALKDGGISLHSDFLPTAGTLAQAIAIEQGRPENNLDPSVKWWTPEEISEIVRKEGFDDIDVKYFDWDVRFDYQIAVEQLKRWGAKPEFISSKEEDLRKHGMELPISFIVTAGRWGDG